MTSTPTPTPIPPQEPAVAFHCESAWLEDGPVDRVRVVVDASGVVVSVAADETPRPDDVRLRGLILPGFANAHSHAFHRALRGRTHVRGGTFWTWRREMYRLAAALDPDSYRRLATAVYAEMALAGITAVGEFHYLHHDVDGRSYADPNAMGAALIDAASAAGIRLILLDTCYLTGGIGSPLEGVQRRFGDTDADAWADRVAALTSAGASAEGIDMITDRGAAGTPSADGLGGASRTSPSQSPASAPAPGAMVGAAVHSVRAVPPDQLPVVAAAPAASTALHVHLSEQPAENEQCLAAYGRTPTRVLAEAGILGPATTAVHATHLTAADIADLAASGAAVCLCPTTERDLADGIGPAPALRDGGVPLVLGTDQHAVVDMFEEQRAVEHDQRLASGRRGVFRPAELLRMAAIDGHRRLGRSDTGRIAPGFRADLAAVRTNTVRTAGTAPDQLAFAATAADIATVVVGGRVVVDDGQHVLGDVGALLAAAIRDLEETT